MSERAHRLIEAARRPVPEGTYVVGAGLLVSGVTTYGFQILSYRALSKPDYAALSALWVFVFVLAPGFFLPLEQEVGRALAHRRARDIGGGAPVQEGRCGGGGAPRRVAHLPHSRGAPHPPGPRTSATCSAGHCSPRCSATRRSSARSCSRITANARRSQISSLGSSWRASRSCCSRPSRPRCSPSSRDSRGPVVTKTSATASA